MKKAILLSGLSVLLLALNGYSQKINSQAQASVIGENIVQIDSALLANESFKGTSKFELDLFCNQSSSSDSPDKIWLSLKSKSVSEISNGTYRCSNKNVNIRKAFNFYGALISRNAQLKISSGSFKLMLAGANSLNIDCDLTLENGSKLKGSYMVPYRATNWRL